MTEAEYVELLRDKRSDHELGCPTWDPCKCDEPTCPAHFEGCKCPHLGCPTWEKECKCEPVNIPCGGCQGEQPRMNSCVHCKGSGIHSVVEINHIHEAVHTSKLGIPWCPACQSAHVDPHPVPELEAA